MTDEEHEGRRHAGHATLRLEDSEELRAQIAAAVASGRRACLVVLGGVHIGERLPLQGPALIGRDGQADLVLSDAGVSFRHARVHPIGDTWHVTDLNSTNGTFVGGQRITECTLEPGERVRFASVPVRFDVQDALDQAYDAGLERLLNIDELTGLYVPRKFDRELQVLLAAAEQRQSTLGLLVMDLDGLKAINDSHGHAFGAYVIAEAGGVIGQTLAGRGIAARYGGDEFIAALPDMDMTQSIAVAEKVRQAVAAHLFCHEGVVLRPGISIGVATYPASATGAQSLFRRADEALYRAKKAGKNRVCR